MGVKVTTAAGYDLPSSVVTRAGDANMRAGTIVLLDFSRPECWVSSAPFNLAATQATALVGNACHPVLDGKLANIRLLNGALGFGAEGAGMRFPTVLTDYWLGKTIAVSCVFRVVNGTTQPWRANTAYAEGVQLWADLDASPDWPDAAIYTVTTAGTTGATPPTHTTGAAANGTATLTFGVAYNSDPDYGYVQPGPMLFLDNNGTFPAAAELLSHVPVNDYISPPLNVAHGPIRLGKFNHITFSPTANILNGIADVYGSTVAVEATPTARAVWFRPELDSGVALYNATTGAVAANTSGLYLELARLVIEDLTVSGRTHAEFNADERRTMRAWHPLRLQIA